MVRRKAYISIKCNVCILFENIGADPLCAFGPNPILLRLCLSWKISARRGLHHATPPVTQGVGLQCVISFCETVNILAFSDKHRVLGPFITSIPKRIWLLLLMDIKHFYYFVNTDKNTLINIWKVQWKRDMHVHCIHWADVVIV